MDAGVEGYVALQIRATGGSFQVGQIIHPGDIDCHGGDGSGRYVVVLADILRLHCGHRRLIRDGNSFQSQIPQATVRGIHRRSRRDHGAVGSREGHLYPGLGAGLAHHAQLGRMQVQVLSAVRAREHDRQEAGQELGVLPKSIGDLTDEGVGIAPLAGINLHSAGCQSGQNFCLNDFRRTALKYR